ncbi:hypothetical protein ACIRRH_21165 [Kitasatospora sp. NPDC101235]|uniref:hypothetical protein n=1 Tax=Kitasatospora sp. NPDC101235 TaxID=3364101 RepID=UPI003801C1F4
MSIFATWLYFGGDDDSDAPAPRIYQGSHVSPADDDRRGGWLELGVIPNHCHPDARFGDAPEPEGGWPLPVEYLRLGLGRPAEDGPEGADGAANGAGSQATVILDRAQAELLHATLTQWLNTDRR